jgi:hypothetical protein
MRGRVGQRLQYGDGQPSAAVCARGITDPASAGDVSAILGPIRDTHNALVKYFAQSPRPAADYNMAKFRMVIRKLDLHTSDDSTQWTGTFREPANGIIGASDLLIQNLLVGVSPTRYRASFRRRRQFSPRLGLTRYGGP